MNTRERILDAALRLFNEAGTDAVSTNHIAAALGISPGNLYYHFRNKEEIIRAIFERLFAAWDAELTLPSHRAPVLDDVQRLVHDNFKIMWDYRFVYRELAALLHHDPMLRSRYGDVRKRGFSDFRQLFAEFVAAGVLASPHGPDEVPRLAELCWLISEFWLPSIEVSGQAVDSEALHHGIELMMQVLRPYVVSNSGF